MHERGASGPLPEQQHGRGLYDRAAPGPAQQRGQHERRAIGPTPDQERGMRERVRRPMHEHEALPR